jgi:hypothetical protein
MLAIKKEFQSEGEKKPMTAHDVAKRFDECVSVFQRMPSAVKFGYAKHWPEIKHTPEELARQERKIFTTLKPLPDAIERAEETLSWITLVNHGERNLIWLRAHRVSWKGIVRETGFPMRSAKRYWSQALEKIADQLNLTN